MSTIPTITKRDIRTFVGEQNFLKGQQHVRDGAIVNPEQEAMTLKAYCYGSLPEPSRVQVTFNGTGITAALCSCSTGAPTYGTRGCEHAAALLHAWNEQPETFAEMDDIDTILEHQSKAQLITLIKQLLQKQPKVEWQLTMPPLPGHKSVPIDADEYRRQVDAAFRHAGRKWDAVYGISSDLSSITETAARFFRQQDYTNAAAIYISMELGNWEAVRQEALTFLETTNNISTLVAVALDEGDSERALQLLKATKPSGPDGYQWQYDYARAPEVALKAAERTEEAYPRASIDLYQQHVERLIAGRGRANYQAACRYLVKIRTLYEKLNETGQWTTYIAWLRKRHSRLSTLKEELAAASL